METTTHNPAEALRYLTVQDMLWINLQVTKTVNTYHFATLEEGTFYQYNYGQSTDLPGQAAKFLRGFIKMAPFSKGNEATAFIGLVAFLHLNRRPLNLSDSEAADWVRRVQSGQTNALDTITSSGDAHHHHQHDLSLEEVVAEAFDRYPRSIESLAQGS